MENIDKIIYINLDRRTDRNSEILAEFKRLNIPDDKIIRFSAINNGDSLSSCTYSHSAALELAQKLNLKNVLILEDDFNFMEDNEIIQNNLTHFFKTITDWDVLLFSKCRYKLKNIDDIISICKETRNACGYLVNSNMFQNLSNMFKFGGDKLIETKAHWIFAVDVIWNQFMTNEKWFCFQKHLGYQRESFSDLSNQIVFYEDQKHFKDY